MKVIHELADDQGPRRHGLPHKALGVPMRLDALFVASSSVVNLAAATSAFDRLGQVASGDDHQMPWLGLTANVAIKDRRPLPPGMHLHWTLPRALRTGKVLHGLPPRARHKVLAQGVPKNLLNQLIQAIDQRFPHRPHQQDARWLSRDELVDVMAELAGVPTASNASHNDLAYRRHHRHRHAANGLTAPHTNDTELRWDPASYSALSPLVLDASAQLRLLPAPNRWLIYRQDGDLPGADTDADADADADRGRDALSNSKAWVLESDHLSRSINGKAPDGAGPQAIPSWFSTAQTGRGVQDLTPDDMRYFLGHSFAGQDWAERPATRLSPLNALGNGAQDFAVYYPNCQGVFGFHDPTAKADQAYRYTVLGWHSDPSDDPIAHHSLAPWSTATTFSERLADLKWALPANVDPDNLDASVYCATIVASSTACPVRARRDLNGVTVSVGSSAAEALSAYICQHIAQRDGPASPLGPRTESVLTFLANGKLDHLNTTDGPLALDYLTHESGFRRSDGGSVWQVTAKHRETEAIQPLPTDVAKAVQALNAAQRALDRSHQLLDRQRRDLFYDWVRCQLLDSEYLSRIRHQLPFDPHAVINDPDYQYLLDEAAAYLLAGQDQVVGALNALGHSLSGDGGGDGDGEGEGDGQASTFVQQVLALRSALMALSHSFEQHQSLLNFSLAREAGPMFHRPQDPSIALVAEDNSTALSLYPASPVERNADGATLCMPLSQQPLGALDNIPIAGFVRPLMDGHFAQSIACTSWRPLHLIWRADILRADDTGNIRYVEHGGQGTFQAQNFPNNHIAQNFIESREGLEFTRPAGSEQWQNQLAFSARLSLGNTLPKSLKAQIQQAVSPTGDDSPIENPDDMGLPANLDSPRLRAVLWDAYQSDRIVLNQGLDGFHQALLMLDQNPQVSSFTTDQELGDSVPLGPWSEDLQSFVPNMEGAKLGSPSLFGGYVPLRGVMGQISEIEIVDAFGQIGTWSYQPTLSNTVIASSFQRPPGPDHAAQFFLAPRFCQDVRLALHWISADQPLALPPVLDDPRHPASSPILAWVSLNRLNQRIMLHAPDGTCAGWIDATNAQTTWINPSAASLQQNPWLAKIVPLIQANAAQFYDDLNQAALNIHPFATDAGAEALTHSRPFALTRFHVQLVPRGDVAFHQGLAAVGLSQFSGPGQPRHRPSHPATLDRPTMGIENVNIPVSVGELSREDDGLALFWKTSGNDIDGDYTANTLGTAQAHLGKIQIDFNLTLNPDDAGQSLLALVDPLAPVHLVTRVLPVGHLSIPEHYVTPALGALRPYLSFDNLVGQPERLAEALVPKLGARTWVWAGGPTAPAGDEQSAAEALTNTAPATLNSGYVEPVKTFPSPVTAAPKVESHGDNASGQDTTNRGRPS